MPVLAWFFPGTFIDGDMHMTELQKPWNVGNKMVSSFFQGHYHIGHYHIATVMIENSNSE